ncbi:DedA family protein [Pseudoponticoccus marisrubri]|uniref:VTT domain-containing protein n=1 Tax=Pseudoponticoccus marisrubri TaxID=1685382 RepID=A0A0W7WKU8_9RHOB|nr:VTT domain-containing protein [Pseudoponticoccus marisrubri]KUF11158.1 hypothetical protein AVJ23_08880 [Pseudoponticoccus marisrubri]
MTETLFALVPVYGGWILLVGTYLSCLALPIPASLFMLTAGAFAAAGDLALSSSAGAALAGAIAGDQTGFAIGRRGGTPLVRRLKARRRTGSTVRQAEAMLDRHGVAAVFLTRWLFSPLGPWVNFIGGALSLGWARFTLGSVAGETVWVCVYVGLGFAFAGQIALVAELAADFAGLLAAGAVAVLLGRLLFRRS